MISTNNYKYFVIIKTQKSVDCNLGPTDGVLPSHEIVNDLQHRPIEGGRMVKP